MRRAREAANAALDPDGPQGRCRYQHGWFAHLPFHEATWQRYESGYGHIGPHRDQAFYKGVILIVTLAGEAESTVLESRDPPLTLDRWTTAAGDMVLLRGADLGVCGARCPLHQIGTPTSGRLTLTLRHNERGYTRWPTP